MSDRLEGPLAALRDGVLSGDRATIGRAITLLESSRPDHREDARVLLAGLGPATGDAHRLGITGVPGVGKSTFIEALGIHLTTAGHRVAVLAVDPTSSVTGGSILGDKTRMQRLANDPNAFVRPSPSSGTLGGVTRSTNETILLLEAAGFDVVLVETVGVGQSETAVASMVDFFLLLMLPGAGDELQGIKKGVLELADMIAVNKDDGDGMADARAAARDYSAAMRLTSPGTSSWTPPVVTCSSITGEGLAGIWDQVAAHREALTESGEWDDNRRTQRLAWMWSTLEDRLLNAVRDDPAVLEILPELEAGVLDGVITPSVAADTLLDAFGGLPPATP
ncbi:MAG: methylmalonyl Co-A mutase-associated GTPase MeaB [Acidimicrobiia bacterium]|nr:methylmalonyl Co-A mutase-associated GTPase MeaB [Actinomycetota bacterium]MBL6924457.1 methylmalonyl Co-A mutase-associated GTPase MeaB [Acidimicrobiia bacterium]MBL6926615.1 methylmalonyl Co-A mutase-associated GTPase MeaB [Acidimicrobiia bacterium]